MIKIGVYGISTYPEAIGICCSPKYQTTQRPLKTSFLLLSCEGPQWVNVTGRVCKENLNCLWFIHQKRFREKRGQSLSQNYIETQLFQISGYNEQKC